MHTNSQKEKNISLLYFLFSLEGCIHNYDLNQINRIHIPKAVLLSQSRF